MNEYYKTLGLTSDATQEEIKIAYRKLSKKFHPDLNEGDKFFEDRFKEIQEAFEKLTSNKTEFSKKSDESKKSKPQGESCSTKPKEQSQPNVKKKTYINLIIILIIVFFVGIIKVALQKSIRENATEELMKTDFSPDTAEINRLSYIDSSASIASKVIDSIPQNIINTDSINQKNINSLVDDTENPSKSETEKWILQKFNNYNCDYTFCIDRQNFPSIDGIHCSTYKDFKYKFFEVFTYLLNIIFWYLTF